MLNHVPAGKRSLLAALPLVFEHGTALILSQRLTEMSSTEASEYLHTKRPQPSSFLLSSCSAENDVWLFLFRACRCANSNGSATNLRSPWPTRMSTL